MASEVDPADDAILRIFGDVDIATSSSFEQLAETMLAQDGRDLLVLDLGDVTFMDSSGVEMLIQVRVSSASRDVELRLRNPSDRVVELFRMAGVIDGFTIDRN